MVDPSAAVARGLMQQLQPQLARQQVQQATLANQDTQLKLQMQQRVMQRQLGFQQAWANSDGSVQGFNNVLKMYPDMVAQAKEVHDAQDSATKTGYLRTAGTALSLLNGGDTGGAIAVVKQFKLANAKAGIQDPLTDAVYGALTSGNLDAAKKTLAYVAATSVDSQYAPGLLESLGFSQKPVITKGGETATNQLTGESTYTPLPNTAETLNTPSGGQKLDVFNPNPGQPGVPPVPAGSPAPPSGESAGAPGGEGGFSAAVNHVLNNEGGYAAHDMNGAPVNMGINQSANPGVDVKNLTRDRAVQIYHDKYWVKSGAAGLPANAQAPYFDAYVRNPAIAKTSWAQSGGDPAKFVQIAEAKFAAIAARKGGKYSQAYANRAAGNLAIASGQAAPPGVPTGRLAPTAGSPAPGQATTLDSTDNPNIPNTKNASPGYHWDANGQEAPNKGGPEDPANYPDMTNATRDYILTGTLPSFNGTAGVPVKKAIMQGANTLMSQLGITPAQLPQLRARYTADKAAYTQVATMVSSLQGSENAMLSNIQQARTAAHNLVQLGVTGGSPFVNQHMLTTYEQIGTPKQKAAIQQFITAMNGVSGEYAKFMSSSSGSSGGAPTDSMKHQADEIVNRNLGAGTLDAGFDQMTKEAANVRSGREAQMANLDRHLSSYLQPQHAAAGNIPTLSPQQAASAPSGTRFRGTNGQIYTKR